jgi:hypothetical protein
MNKKLLLVCIVIVSFYSFGIAAGENKIISKNKKKERDTLFTDLSVFYNSYAPKNPFSLFTFENDNRFFQIRYNYEYLNSLTLFVGSPFIKNKKAHMLDITPIIGFTLGEATASTTGVIILYNISYFELYNNSQITNSLLKKDVIPSFYFQWLELLYNHKNIWKAGYVCRIYKTLFNESLQHGIQADVIDNGLLITSGWKNFYASGYLLNFWNPQQIGFFIGISYRFQIRI